MKKFVSRTDLSDVIHGNFHSLLRLMCQHTEGFDWIEHKDVTFMVCNSPTSIYNRVIETRFEDFMVENRIEEVSDHYSSLGLPFLWMVGPRDTPTDLSSHLEKAGFGKSSSSGMAIDLNQLKPPKAPQGFRLEKVEDEESLMTYSRLMPSAFGFDDLSREAVSSWIEGVGLQKCISHYIGYLDEVPVASSSVFYDDGVVGLYCVASRQEARGKGIGSVMSAIPLIVAFDEGYQWGVLHSTSNAHGVYLNLGFRDYCEILNYSRESGDSYLKIFNR